MTRDELVKEIDEILGDKYGGGIHRKANKILLLSGEFREKADDEIKNELKKLGRAAILLESHEDLLLSIKQATSKDIHFHIDQYPHGREEDNNNLTLNVNINMDKNIEPLINREKEISEELKELNIDYSMLISWLRMNVKR